MIRYTGTQIQRLAELNISKELTEITFDSLEDREAEFKKTEKALIQKNRQRLKLFLEEDHIPMLLRVEDSLERWLVFEEGYTRVATPIIISSEKIKKMNIDMDNHLREQIFWIDGKKCLRPMLAPNLYEVMRRLHKTTGKPVKIFEAGSCFRKESQGAQHMNEFTMLNLVELDSVVEGEQFERLEVLADKLMKAVGIDCYEIVKEKSGVYNETLDIVVDGVELASGAYGPHPLDANWGIFSPWVGIGIGLERVAMVKGEFENIKRAGKSVSYVGGVSLKL